MPTLALSHGAIKYLLVFPRQKYKCKAWLALTSQLGSTLMTPELTGWKESLQLTQEK